MRAWRNFAMCVVVAATSQVAWCIEPTENSFSNMLKSPPAPSIGDVVAAASISEPDTFLGVQDLFGIIYATDDDGSPLGNGLASGMQGVPTNSGGISFSVTGFGDEFFVGNHGEAGGYRVFVDVYDLFGDQIESFSETRVLGPGFVHDFSYSDFEWLGGSYDVYIDNTVGVVPEPRAFWLLALASLGAILSSRRR